jgi:hypothetical protein
MHSFEPGFLPTALGSLPHREVQPAMDTVQRYFHQVPMWPQLPRRSFLENMYVQYSRGLPGACVDGEHERIYVDRRSPRLDAEIEAVYTAYLEARPEAFALEPDYAAGLPALLALEGQLGPALAVKGHVTGPISLGLQVTDQDRRPILYDDVLADVIAKLIRMQAQWQEAQLLRLAPQTIIFVDEPYMSTYGSAYVALGRDQVVDAVGEVLSGIAGLKGLHCCGNTDWALLLDTPLDIISFDAYRYAVSFSLYAGAVRDFLRRGGIIAWGIVPNDAGLLDEETPDSLVEKLLAAMELLVQKGVPRDDLLQRGMVSAACGLGTLSVGAAARACQLTLAVSQQMRDRFGLAKPG